ncbi:MAG: aminotransferase class I/II-fold pyridoxal phosphate-dependent enzyme, partial [Bacteroidota bacterium]|nr:aminotransferase class I/II-fold pyridoxal phosphate-dependent enzyme [Bacteroidota bacterium]
MPQISVKGQQLPLSPIRKLTPYADAVKRSGVKVYHLNIGQPDLPTPKKALDALKAYDAETLSYTPSQGILSLRQGLQRYYKRFGIDLALDEMIVTTGGSEALLFAFQGCLNPGDEIIMTEPTYANYMTFAKLAGVTVRTVTSSIENGFALPDIAEFEAAITPSTRAILLSNPNNPTGYVYTRSELMKIRDIV